jgi:Ca2+-binding RTX toxin-like protein
MPEVPFSNAVPNRYLWVDGSAPDGGNGNKESPLNNIHTAIAKAKPGTAIMVEAGEYHTNIFVKRTADGTPDAPIWLISADGPGKAHIIAKDQSMAAIGGGGVQNFIVEGFMTTGGKNGIHFGQNGYDFTDIVSNIVIRNNIIVNPVEDGVKANAGFGVYVINNDITGGRDEGIDFVAIRGGIISGNEVSGNTGTSAGIFAKFGSTDIVISNNYVHDNAAIGISVGGYVNAEMNMMTGTETFQAKNVVVRDNIIVDNGRVPIAVFGSQNVKINNNILDVNNKYFTAIFVGSSNPTKYGVFTSSDVEISNNVLNEHRRPLTVGVGSSAVFTDNGPSVAINTAKMGFLAAYLKDSGSPKGGDIVSAPEQTPAPEPAPTPAPQPEPAEDARFKLITLDKLFSLTWAESGAVQQTAKNGLGTALNDDMRGKGDQFVGGAGDDTYTLSRAQSERISEMANGGIDTQIVQGRFGALASNVENLKLASTIGATLFGNAMDNRIVGGSGNDVINGKGGKDHLTGNGGADRFVIGSDAALTRIVDFSSDDSIHISELTATSFEDLKSGMAEYKGSTFLVLEDGRTIIFENAKPSDFSAMQFGLPETIDAAREGATGSKVVSVSAASMSAEGTVANEIINGNGSAVLVGGSGDDRYILSKAGDRIVELGNGGTDTVLLRFADYHLDAGVENVISRFDAGGSVTGNGLANIIKGGAGNDWISGGAGADVLSGGAGADTFAYSTLGDAGDSITDFRIGTDRLDLSALKAANPGLVLHVEATKTGAAVYAEVQGIDTLIVSLENVGSPLALQFYELIA